MHNDDENSVAGQSADEWALLLALRIQKEHGHNGPLFIAEMLGKFAIDGDVKSIRTYQEIARAYETLLIPKAAKH